MSFICRSIRRREFFQSVGVNRREFAIMFPIILIVYPIHPTPSPFANPLPQAQKGALHEPYMYLINKHTSTTNKNIKNSIE